ncbi:MAG: preprotein translocase subunit SecG [Christensenellaceae bacterium]|jgi:preprotein translocase subunit SecG
MDVVSLIIKIVLCLCSLFLIIVVLLQQEEGPKPVGAGGVSKKRGKEAVLVRLTKISAVGFIVLALALVLLQHFF